MSWARAALGLALAALLAGCYTSRTVVLDEQTAAILDGVRPGLYCHAEPSLDGHIGPDFEISASLGENRCRDLVLDAAERRYVDQRSSSMLFRVGTMGEVVDLLQVQTGSTAPARYAPIAAVDGLFVMLDPAGRWPADIVAEQGVELDADGEMPDIGRDKLAAILKEVLASVLEDFRAELSVDESGTGLRFAEGASLQYLVWVHDDLRGNPEAMGRAVSELASRLGLDSQPIR